MVNLLIKVLARFKGLIPPKELVVGVQIDWQCFAQSQIHLNQSNQLTPPNRVRSKQGAVNMDDVPPEFTKYTDQSLSAIHHALRASRRRLVIALVAHRALSPHSSIEIRNVPTQSSISDATVSASQLAREITSIEHNISLEHATGSQYHNTYTALIQTHLPELDNLGAIKYDKDRKEICSDRNLIAMAMVAAITSPIAQVLFHTALSNHDLGGPRSL